MSALAFMVCLALQTPPTAPPGPGDMTLLGKNVGFEAPKQSVAASGLSAEVLNWEGWGPLHTPDAAAPAIFPADADWSSVVGKWTKPDVAAPVWRVKVLVVDQTDILSKMPDGVLVERRSSITKDSRAALMRGLVLAARTIEVQLDGHIQVQYDIQEDSELYEQTDPEQGGPALVGEALRAYVSPRINGGSFEADDHVYRGPYELCLVIHPALTSTEVSADMLFTTPLFSVPLLGREASAGALASVFVREYAAAALIRAEQHGRRVETQPTQGAIPWMLSGESADRIAAEMSLAPATADSFMAESKLDPLSAQAWPGMPSPNASSVERDTVVAIANDKDKGSVLDVKLNSAYRYGGMTVPLPKSIDSVRAGQNHFLTFEVKTSTRDSLSIGPLRGRLELPGIALGARPNAGPAIKVPSDGSWHKVAVDLSALLANADGLYIGVEPDEVAYERLSGSAFEADFANFGLAAAIPADASSPENVAGPDWLARLAELKIAAGSPAEPAHAILLTAALADPNDQVRLNATALFTTVKAPNLLDKIIANVGNLDPRITEQAIDALRFQDTPVAWDALKDAVRLGPGTHTRAVAGLAVGTLHDPKLAGILSSLCQLSSPNGRRMGVDAMAEDAGPNGILMAIYLDDPDPSVRLRAAERYSPTTKDGIQRLTFASVNDPSDAVRAAACIQLLKTGDMAVRPDGLRGLNDDSERVRFEVAHWMVGKAKPSDLAAMRQALTTASAPVRAEVLGALATGPSPLKIEDIEPALMDSRPVVQRALLALVRVKKLALPADAVASLKASIDPNIAAEAAKLGP